MATSFIPSYSVDNFLRRKLTITQMVLGVKRYRRISRAPTICGSYARF